MTFEKLKKLRVIYEVIIMSYLMIIITFIILFYYYNFFYKNYVQISSFLK